MGPLSVIGLVGDAIGFADIIYGIAKDGIDSDGFENFLDPDAEMNAHFDEVRVQFDEVKDQLKDMQASINAVFDDLATLQDTVDIGFTAAAVARVTEPMAGVISVMDDIGTWDAMFEGDPKEQFGNGLVLRASVEMEKLLNAAREVIDAGNPQEVGIAVKSLIVASAARVQLANTLTEGGYRDPSVQSDLREIKDLMEAAKPILAEALISDDGELSIGGPLGMTTMTIGFDVPGIDTDHLLAEVLNEMGLYPGDLPPGGFVSRGSDVLFIETPDWVAVDNDFFRHPTITLPGGMTIASPDDRLARPHGDTWLINTQTELGQTQLSYALPHSMEEIRMRLAEKVLEELGYDEQIETFHEIGNSNAVFTATEQADTINGSTGDDFLYGKGGDDILNGYGGDDSLRADGGDDTLDGGQGSDVLTGGEGADTFVFGGIPGNDTITDFQQGEDKIDFYAIESPRFQDGFFSKLVDGITEENIAQGSARDSDDYLIQVGDKVYYDADGSGAGAAVEFLTMENSVVLTAADFVKGQVSASGEEQTTTADQFTTGADVVTLTEGGTVLALKGHDRVEGSEDRDVIHGNGGNDTLDGNGGNDRLSGGRGNDHLQDGAGSDILAGGRGADVFVFENDSSTDYVRDFQDGLDMISLAGQSFEELGIYDAQNGKVVIRDANDDKIVLRGDDVTASDLTADDFLF